MAEVHRRNQTLARRARATLLQLGLVDESVEEDAFVLMVELGDRVLDLAFRDRLRADRDVIQQEPTRSAPTWSSSRLCEQHHERAVTDLTQRGGRGHQAGCSRRKP